MTNSAADENVSASEKTRAELRELRRVRPKREREGRAEPPLVRALGAAITLVFRAFSGFLGVLPREVALELGAFVGGLGSYVLLDRRRTARENLERAFPAMDPRERARILKRSFENAGRTFVELILFPHTSPRRLLSLVEVVGRDHYERYREAREREGKTAGALALSAHLGNFEMVCAVFNDVGMIRSSLIGRKIKPEAVDAIVCGLRMSHQAATIANKDSVREVVARVARGEGVGVVLDQNMRRGHGVFVPFFGRPASTTAGLAVLARRTGVPVFPVFMARRGSLGRHRLEIQRPLEWVEGDDKKAALVANTAVYTKVIEDAVRRRPEEWFWFHRRWRTQPLPADAGAPAEKEEEDE